MYSFYEDKEMKRRIVMEEIYEEVLQMRHRTELAVQRMQEAQRQKEFQEMNYMRNELAQSVERMSLHLQTIIDNNSRRERQEAHEKVISSMEDNDVEDEPREVVLQPVPILLPPPYSLKGTEKLTCGSELVDVLKLDETCPPNEEVVDLEFIHTLMNEEESTISIDEGHVDGVKGKHTWGVQEEMVDFHQFQAEKIPKVLEEWSKKDFPLCWMIQKYASWRHDKLIDGTFLWYQDGYSE
ncbi:OLC1v1001154C1 [Oldenlandia corymbosa var. corymbosa]|uniref:OLC1v1001154C1 n=1 Tax=Oldenlandia corymbosa var. corymbosa TaxID=529605 RepID=A0AAV1D4L1_OLDCO|nr:OLC1v1001154C1 [Oldenlandia corymbosa var. corymbosa]